MTDDASASQGAPVGPEPLPRLGGVIGRAGLFAWSVLGILALLAAVGWLFIQVRILLAPVVVATVLIYVLNPVVNRLAAWRIPRVLGALLAFVGLLGILVLLGFLVVPSVAHQASEFAADFPQIYEDSAEEVEQLVGRLGFGEVDLWSYDQLVEFTQDPERQDQLVSAVLDNIGQVTSGIFEAILVFFVAPVVAFYVLVDLPRVRTHGVGLVPEHLRDEVVHVSRRLGSAVGGFLRGQVLVAIIVGILTSVGFRLIGLQFWLIIGMLAGFLNIIPFVGPWVGGTLGVIVGLVTGSVQTALLAGVVALVVQQIDNNFVSPTVLRATVRLHPAVVLLVLILGGAIGGVWGVVLAVPVTAAVKILLGHLWRTRVLGQSWEEATEALLEPLEPSLVRLRREAEELDEAADAREAAAGEEPEREPPPLEGE